MVIKGMKRLLWIGVVFILISIVTRIGLGIFSGESYTALEWVRIMAVGMVFDLATLPWFLLPWVIYEALLPDLSARPKLAKWEAVWALIWATFYLGLFVVVACSEFAFWAEFASRFDFIAVDYLVYTHEVIGNIRESYPVFLWLGIIAVASGVITWFSWPRKDAPCRTGLVARLGSVAIVALAAFTGMNVVDQRLADGASSTYVAQLSNNGIYAFGHAYRNNQLDYDRYYPSRPNKEINTAIRSLVQQSNATFTGPEGIERNIVSANTTKKVNVVLISVESLSAEYLGQFGNNQNLTPELDKLADKGLFFTNLYATGTRTVRGLEALSIGTPPTPGQSIVRRPHNANMENLGEELGENGWSPFWIYGGYGFFDNMNAYFGSNGYKVIDRTNLEEENIPVHAENIWGVADEDLFSLALTTFDRSYADGKPFFAHVMTTSNHRPYTFPEGRIDLAQKKREGAVKYTDWALGDFIRRSASKPWFDDTVFIILADHTAKAAGKTDLPPSRYHIPMIWYAPKLIQPERMDRLMSQIDVAPTLMGWLGLSYSSRFFGYDMFNLEQGRERAFISTYQKLGYMKDNRLVVLDVNRPAIVVDADPHHPGKTQPLPDDVLIKEAIAWYQSASMYFKEGMLRDVKD